MWWLTSNRTYKTCVTLYLECDANRAEKNGNDERKCETEGLDAQKGWAELYIACRGNISHVHVVMTESVPRSSSFSQDKHQHLLQPHRSRKNDRSSSSSSKKSRAGLRRDYISPVGRTNLSNECTTICQPNLSRRPRRIYIHIYIGTLRIGTRKDKDLIRALNILCFRGRVVNSGIITAILYIYIHAQQWRCAFSLLTVSACVHVCVHIYSQPTRAFSVTWSNGTTTHTRGTPHELYARHIMVC